MSAIERFRGRTTESTPVELVQQRYELQSLNDRVDGWTAMSRIEIGSVLAYGAMGCAARVYGAAEAFEQRTPGAGDTYRQIADSWALGAEGELLKFFRGGQR